jgi:hypothetical protein
MLVTVKLFVVAIDEDVLGVVVLVVPDPVVDVEIGTVGPDAVDNPVVDVEIGIVGPDAVDKVGPAVVVVFVGKIIGVPVL